MAQSSSCTSILRFACANEELSSKVVDAILSYIAKKRRNSTLETSSDITILKADGLLTISNKYFDAKIFLLDLMAPTNCLPPNSKEDGVILIFDNTCKNNEKGSSSFDSLSKFTSCNNYSPCGDLLRLCIGVCDEQQSPTADEEYSRRILWCLDDGYEYVEADFSSSGQENGHNERDKEGFARIIEALEGTVWSSAVMKKKESNKLSTSFQETRDKLSRNVSGEENKKAQTEKEQGTSESVDREREIKARQALLEQDVISGSRNGNCDEDGMLGSIDDDKKKTNQELQQSQKEKESEQFFNQFEGTLREVNKIREASKNRELNDDERKKRAEDAAVLLMGLMDQIGGLDSDSDSEEAEAEAVAVDNEVKDDGK